VGTRLSLGDRTLKAQMKQANASGARYALLIGEGELERGEVTVRDLAAPEEAEERKQISVKRAEVLAFVHPGASR
jgi:histidyl-tRNA synthetase